VAGECSLEQNIELHLTMYGRELKDDCYIICEADMRTKGQGMAKIIGTYFRCEVLPNEPVAWIDEGKKIGYETSLNWGCCVYEPPRSLHTDDGQLQAVSANNTIIQEDLAE